jgi:hypothetical protein
VGNPHAGFDEAGAGNVTMGAGLRPRTKVLDEPPDPKVRAPVLDPTCEGVGVKFPRATRPLIHTFDPSIFTPRYGSSVSNRKVGIKVCNVNFEETSANFKYQR